MYGLISLFLDRLVDKISTSSHSSEKTLEKFPLIDTGTPNPRNFLYYFSCIFINHNV